VRKESELALRLFKAEMRQMRNVLWLDTYSSTELSNWLCLDDIASVLQS